MGVAVSCSDDLGERQGDNTDGNEGPKTYMTVTVRQGVQTRATGGEEGDKVGDVSGEAGSEAESEVKDVTVFLYRGENNTEPSEFKGTSMIMAAGFANEVGSMSGSSESWHSWTSSVEVEINDQTFEYDNKLFGIIAVTNLGKTAADALIDKVKNKSITTGKNLADQIQIFAWSDEGSSANSFIMSTHNDQYGMDSKIFDSVILKANATSTDAPMAEVHVERLAAKIRMAGKDGVTDFIYELKATDEGGTAGDVIAKVRLDQVKVVNRLNSGSYLLKRVSETVSGADDKIDDANKDIYLGNEICSSVTGGTSSYNYVIDPWTRSKTQGSVSSISSITAASGSTMLSYDNPFSGDSYEALWGSEPQTELSGNDSFDDSQKVLLCYTQENTTTATNSLDGYSTGAIFKATYFPKEWVVTKLGENQEVTGVKTEPITYGGSGAEGLAEGGDGDNLSSISTETGGKTFYVYQGQAYRNHEAVFNAWAFNQQETMVYSYVSFTKNEITSIKKSDFKKAAIAEHEDPFGYIADLKKKAESGSEEYFTEEDAIETFLEENSAEVNKVVYPYENGVCYYPYWIRHADNKKPSEIGVMEFGIVRNNIYDLSVSGISDIGLPGTHEPDPEKPNEDDDILINVVVLVKDWVVRSNSDIIL